MWRSAFIILPVLAGSPAFAGQASTVIHVGITITGHAVQTPAKAGTSDGSGQAVAGALGGAKAATVKSSARARRPQVNQVPRSSLNSP